MLETMIYYPRLYEYLKMMSNLRGGYKISRAMSWIISYLLFSVSLVKKIYLASVQNARNMNNCVYDLDILLLCNLSTSKIAS